MLIGNTNTFRIYSEKNRCSLYIYVSRAIHAPVTLFILNYYILLLVQ